MSLPCLKNVLIESDCREGPNLARTIDDTDYVGALMVVITIVVMATGCSLALGLRLESGIVFTALACIGYAGVLFNSRASQTAVEPQNAPAVEPASRRERAMQITLHTPDTIYSPRHIPSWFALACAAGAVNGFAFLSCEEFVSHITGTTTRIGLELHHLGIAVEYTAVLLSFVIGAMASVIWLQARACQGKKPRWATPLRAVSLILACTAIAGHYGYFGPFGGQNSGEPPFVLLSLLAFSMGLQNAAVASTTGLAVRTTHLTGPATDLGIHLGTAFFASGKERRDSYKGAGLRVVKIVAFATGAGISLPLAERLGYLCLLAPAALISFAAVLSYVPKWSPSDFPFRRTLTTNDPEQSKRLQA